MRDVLLACFLPTAPAADRTAPVRETPPRRPAGSPCGNLCAAGGPAKRFSLVAAALLLTLATAVACGGESPSPPDAGAADSASAGSVPPAWDLPPTAPDDAARVAFLLSRAASGDPEEERWAAGQIVAAGEAAKAPLLAALAAALGDRPERAEKLLAVFAAVTVRRTPSPCR